MRTGLQPVAISCNKNFYHGPFAALVDARALSENASDASNGIRKPILCRNTNVAKLAFYEVHRLQISQIRLHGWRIAPSRSDRAKPG